MIRGRDCVRRGSGVYRDPKSDVKNELVRKNISENINHFHNAFFK